MAESSLHLAMKTLAYRSLSGEGYEVTFEPSYSPVSSIGWSRYRPDLFGVRETDEGSEFVLVECETHPQTKRIEQKEFLHVSFQSSLDHVRSLRRVLLVPRGRLSALEMRVRRNCEIWVTRVGPAGEEGVAELEMKVPRVAL